MYFYCELFICTTIISNFCLLKSETFQQGLSNYFGLYSKFTSNQLVSLVVSSFLNVFWSNDPLRAKVLSKCFENLKVFLQHQMFLLETFYFITRWLFVIALFCRFWSYGQRTAKKSAKNHCFNGFALFRHFFLGYNAASF